ncbi:sodium-dependent transporter [Kroppenstedtia pulmonis]|uniref:Sodium-dependent transporter n=1 Tax=Kroppenstedtia pulmonis TaxID=1380685 RepID=A0A7D4BGN2_9BACL|nr:sodium-dependent transporter [Kroppenstedtia pulmonis]QKG83715.1 sodium-dependent transporter [Kroppenstedtia pulmonis]
MAKEQWTSRAGFILAAVGSAIGLGNIWRYPYVAYENGGGAFLIPYFFALLTAGIPILLLEYSLGHKYRGSAPLSYRRMSEKWEWLGWFHVFMAFLISTYYIVILAWALSYTYYSFGTQWGENTNQFFFQNYLGKTDDFWSFGGLQLKVVLPLLLLWAFLYVVLRRRAHAGIERLNRISMPILVVMMIIITLRGVSLEGATDGLNVLLTPDFAALSDPQVWVSAYGQVFFSLSIGYATMITYASYLAKDSDLGNSGFIAGLSNAGFEFMAALGIFGALGYLATQTGVEVSKVVDGGIGLAFVVFPKIISELPGFNSAFGVLFFGTLVIAGLTSIVSLLEPGISALRDKFNMGRMAAVNSVVGLSALFSLLYATKGGISYLDIVDHYLNNYGLMIAGLGMTLSVAWFAKKIGDLQSHINQVSDVRVGGWWVVSLKVITPIGLLIMTAWNTFDELKEPYGGFPVSGLIAMGWSVLLASLVAAIVLQNKRWKEIDHIRRKEGA